MDRRGFLWCLAALAAPGCTSTSGGRPASLQIEEASLDELRQALASGRISSRWLTAQYRARIESLDRRGPALHSVLLMNPEAERQAVVLDEERRTGRVRGPLHGMPILLKDNLDTGDEQPTTAGSLALAGTRAARDAFVVGKLRAAGAVLLGKTNLSEWANLRSSHSSSGWSALGGQTRNPYVLTRSPSGSSSGSAAAVAASFAAAAVGTETDGSIVSPAACCSLVGLKPTLGLVSRRGIIPISHSQDTAGPMTRTVRDAALLLGVMAGEDPGDPATTAARGRVPRDYTALLLAGDLRGVRLGVARQFFGHHPGTDRLIESRLATLRELGAELVDPVTIPHLNEFGAAEFEVLLYELKADLAAYLATRGNTVAVHSLTDLIAFNERHRIEEMPHFQQEFFELAERRGPLTDPEYLAARERCRLLAAEQGLAAVLAEHHLDALVAPTGGPPWLIDWVGGDHGTGGCSSLPAVAGTPHLTVPAGYVEGLPIGISFLGRAWAEADLLRYGHAFEQATRARRAPRFLPADSR